MERIHCILLLKILTMKGWVKGEIGDVTRQGKKQLVEQFCDQKYANSAMVPFLTIPTCGKV